MLVKTKHLISEDESEHVTIITLANNDNIDLDKYVISYNKEDMKHIKNIKDISIQIESLMKMIYNSGLKGEKIDFLSEKEIIYQAELDRVDEMYEQKI